MYCSCCKIYRSQVKEWQDRALKYWGMYSPLPYKIKSLEEALDSEKAMNAHLTEELERLQND